MKKRIVSGFLAILLAAGCTALPAFAETVENENSQAYERAVEGDIEEVCDEQPVMQIQEPESSALSLMEADPHETREQEDIDMTDVSLASEVTAYRTGYAYRGANVKDATAVLSFKNVPEGVTFTEGNDQTDFSVISSSKPGVIAPGNITLNQNKLTFAFTRGGSSTVLLSLNGREFKVRAKCYLIRFSSKSLTVYPKQKKTLRVKGVQEGTRVTFSSSNRKVASVTQKGVVRAKKPGNAVIYARVKGVKIGLVVSVTTKKKVRAIRRATRIARSSEYSQPLRMMKGYYDCSSLVYRAYKPEGYTFGSRYWAPCAADEAYYLACRGRIKYHQSNRNLQKMRYRAGDLMFVTGENNGRYLGIFHVEMFRGYLFLGFTEKNKPIVASRWANFADGYADGRTTGVFGRP